MTGTGRKKKYVIPVRWMKVYQTKKSAIRSSKLMNFNKNRKYLWLRSKEKVNIFFRKQKTQWEFIIDSAAHKYHRGITYKMHQTCFMYLQVMIWCECVHAGSGCQEFSIQRWNSALEDCSYLKGRSQSFIYLNI